MPSIGHYELRVEETVAAPDWDDIASYQIVPLDDADSVQAGATVITNIATPASLSGTLDGGDDAVDYYCFTIGRDRMVHLRLQDLDYNADLVLQDKGANVLATSANTGTAGEEIVQFLAAGKYYVKVEAKEAGDNAYTLRHGMEDLGDLSIVHYDHQAARDAGWGPDGWWRPARKDTTEPGMVGGDHDSEAWYSFTMVEREYDKMIRLRLQEQDADADLHLYDSEGNLLHSSTKDGTANEEIRELLSPGRYYVKVEAEEDSAERVSLPIRRRESLVVTERGALGANGDGLEPRWVRVIRLLDEVDDLTTAFSVNVGGSLSGPPGTRV